MENKVPNSWHRKQRENGGVVDKNTTLQVNDPSPTSLYLLTESLLLIPKGQSPSKHKRILGTVLDPKCNKRENKNLRIIFFCFFRHLIKQKKK